MSQLDKLIERLQPQQELLLETGKEPMMRTDAGTRVMVNQKLSTPHVIALLTEIASGVHKDNVTAKRQTNFAYSYNGKNYTVTFMTQGEQVRSVISITDGETAAVPDAEQEAVEAVEEAEPAVPAL